MPWVKFPMPGWLTAWELARHCNWRNAKTAAGIKDACPATPWCCPFGGGCCESVTEQDWGALISQQEPFSDAG